MRDVTALILAAGLSQRIGDRNKLLLPVNGVPMIRHVVNVYRGVTGEPVVVVMGHEAEAVNAALAGMGFYEDVDTPSEYDALINPNMEETP